ncbi:MAG: peptidoglycan-binding protein [Chloroflexaceae bacterium]|nr:peptidoglycan-binding protein [Chloroflexaceae bacterium]
MLNFLKFRQYKPSTLVDVWGESEILRLGSEGESVRVIQRFLQALGHYSLGIDGYYGAEMENAVRAFQQQIGMNADGVVDERTWRAIKRLRLFLTI